MLWARHLGSESRMRSISVPSIGPKPSCPLRRDLAGRVFERFQENEAAPLPIALSLEYLFIAEDLSGLPKARIRGNKDRRHRRMRQATSSAGHEELLQIIVEPLPAVPVLR